MELTTVQDIESLRPETERAGLFEFDDTSELYPLVSFTLLFTC